MDTRLPRGLACATLVAASLITTTLAPAQAAPPTEDAEPAPPVIAAVEGDLHRGALAAPIDVELEQPDGARFEARAWGDGRIHGYETADSGHTVVKSSSGEWRYATGRRSDGALQPGPARPDSQAAPAGVAPHQRPTVPPAPQSAPSLDEPDGPTPGPLNGGTQPTLVILAQFVDRAGTTPASYWNDRFFGAEGSVRDFYHDASFGQLDIAPASETHGTANDGVVGWVTIPPGPGFTGLHPDTEGAIDSRNQSLTVRALAAANAYVNYATFDSNGDGYLTPGELHVTVIVAGYETAYGGPEGSCSPGVWGHRWSTSGVTQSQLDGKWVGQGGYTQFGELHCSTNDNPGHPATVGIMVHELGHDLGLPDLYDTNYVDQGIGKWSVMAYGSWNSLPGQEQGTLPPMPDAWSKAILGWIDPVASDGSTAQHSLGAAASNPHALQLGDNPGGSTWSSSTAGSGEYFLVENRQLTGWDATLPGCGLLVLHIDESRFSNARFAGDPSRLVTVKQADGLAELQDGESNDYGDGGDPFPGSSNNTLFGPSTNPSSNRYDGSPTDLKMRVDTTTCQPTMNVTVLGDDVGQRPPADFDGNGATDVGVYRPTTGTWHIPGTTRTWGLPGDIPVPGDYNGDGTTDIAVYRPTTGTWHITTGGSRTWGLANVDIPVPGDYNGDGSTDIAVYRPTTGTWHIPGTTRTWGLPGDIPVPGDYNGDGTTDIAVYRPTTGTWHITTGGSRTWGLANVDIPVPGDYNGDGSTDIAVYRPTTGTWHIPGTTRTWGLPGDIPVPGDYNGDGTTDIAVYRPTTGTWHITTGGSRTWGLANVDIPLSAPVHLLDQLTRTGI